MKTDTSKKMLFVSLTRNRKYLWYLILAISTLLFLSHTYGDILLTTRHGINFWNILFKGQIIHFYSYDLLQLQAVYSFPVYVVFALWNFPLWILEYFFKIDVMNIVYCLIWSKIMLLIFLLISTMTMKKICIELGMKKEVGNWCLLFYMSSSFIFSSLFVISQYDIIALSFMLIGVLFYLKGKFSKFIFWFMIAISFKFFALLVYIPLVLLFEKRIIRILKYLVEGISFTLLFSLIFMFDSASKQSGAFMLDAIKLFSNYILQLSIGNTSLFYLLTIILFIYSYYKETKNIEELRNYCVYLSFVVFGIFFACVRTNPYWAIFLTPFTALLIFQNPNRMRINVILEILMCSSLIFAQMIVFYWCFGIQTMKAMILPMLFGNSESFSKIWSTDLITSSYNMNIFLNQYALPILVAVFTSCIIALAWINFPRTEMENNDIDADKNIYFFRILIGGGICLLPIIGYIVSSFN